jgi:integrase
MAGKTRHANLDSRTARARLKRGRNPHWQSIVPGRVALGYQIWKADRDGRWILRRYIGNDKYRSETLGRADDRDPANGVNILSHAQADAKARAMVDAPAAKLHNLTVRQAMDLYVQNLEHIGKPTRDTITRTAVHILPDLGDLVVAELTAERLRRWLSNMANTPAQTRPKNGKPQYRAEAVTDEDVRRRKNTANRVLTILKAALNFAYDEGYVDSNSVWGRKLKGFIGVDAARVRYLPIAEAQRLINACETDFRPLVHAALETGARYSELGRLLVQDFNSEAGTVFIQKSKPGKSRHVILTDQGAEFFRRHCAGRAGGELMLTHDGGLEWRKSDQKRPIREASANARIAPAINFHALRHTWASHAVMAGVQLMVVAKQLGHSDTKMVEKYYSHLAPSYVNEAIRAGAPRYDIELAKKVVPLR